MSHIVRDKTIWNMLVYGNARNPGATIDDNDNDMPTMPLIVDDDSTDTSPSTPSASSEDEDSNDYLDAMEEKRLLAARDYADEEAVIESKQDKQPPLIVVNPEPNTNKKRTVGYVVGWLLAFAVATMFAVHIHGGFGGCSHRHHLLMVARPVVKVEQGFIDDGFKLQAQDNTTVPAREIIAVSHPFKGAKIYGDSVYSAVVVNHTFGYSWGKPAVVTFTPPTDVDYNKVVLTLNTTVAGVQYDRLAHLFVDGVQIWRTSTIEPGGNAVFSIYKKDVSTYLKLFEKPSTFVFQLDNVLSSRLTGEFHIELTVDFYKAEHFYGSEHQHQSHQELPDDVSNIEDVKSEYSIFSTRKPADSIYPLTFGKTKADSPLNYLPSDKIHVQLPTVSVNTTRLVLSIFTSGNAAEESWYTNVIDKYIDKFAKQGRLFNGHGPNRFVNVFFNGEKIAVQTPQPVIFTGGISPALWSSVVSIDAFDVPTIDIDVSGLLPYLWESQAVEDKFLEIEISNGLGELGKASSSLVAENWITTANLLAYQNSEVVEATGEVIDISHNNRGNVIAIAPPFTGSISQIVNGIFSGQLISKFALTLKSGRILHTTLSSYTKGEVSNVQSYSHFGEKQSLVHVGHSVKSFIIQDDDLPVEPENDDDESNGHAKLPANTIHSVNVSLSYPLILSLTEKNKTLIPGQEFEIEYDVSIVNVKDTEISIDEEKLLKVSTRQNGTSKFFLASKGNHGFGKLETKFKVKAKTPEKKYKYLRTVKSENGTIISDESKSKKGNVTEIAKSPSVSSKFGFNFSKCQNKYEQFFERIMSIPENGKFCARGLYKLEQALSDLKSSLWFDFNEFNNGHHRNSGKNFDFYELESAKAELESGELQIVDQDNEHKKKFRGKPKNQKEIGDHDDNKKDSHDRKYKDDKESQHKKHGKDKNRKHSGEDEEEHKKHREEKEEKHRKHSGEDEEEHKKHREEKEEKHRKHSGEDEEEHKKHREEKEEKHRKHSGKDEEEHKKHREEKEEKDRKHREEKEEKHRKHREEKEEKHRKHREDKEEKHREKDEKHRQHHEEKERKHREKEEERRKHHDEKERKHREKEEERRKHHDEKEEKHRKHHEEKEEKHRKHHGEKQEGSPRKNGAYSWVFQLNKYLNNFVKF